MLRLGFFERFKGVDTVLLCGDRGDIAALREKIDFLSSSCAGRSVAIHELCAVSQRSPVELFALPTHSLGNGNSFAYSEDVSGKLAVLEQTTSGHQYFELANQRALMVSVGEYDDSFWRTHG